MGWGASSQFVKINGQWTDEKRIFILTLSFWPFYYPKFISCLREISWVTMLEARVTVQLQFLT